jgi:predicted  nucleic acid-binding Zn-ribbon protein
MDHIDAIVEKIRDAIVGDLRKEFTEFKAEVRGQLEGMQRQLDGFRIAIETMNKRMDSMEQRISRIEARLDETNKRIDTLTLDMNRKKSPHESFLNLLHKFIPINFCELHATCVSTST